MGTVQVDREACRGAAVCTRRAPASFRLDGEKRAVPIDPAGDDEAALRAAVRSCPNFALHWREADHPEGANP